MCGHVLGIFAGSPARELLYAGTAGTVNCDRRLFPCDGGPCAA